MIFQEDPEDNESEILPEDITKCEVVVDTNWYHTAICVHLVAPPSKYSSSATNSSGYGSASVYGGFSSLGYVVPGTLGKNTCNRQVWSIYRKKV